MPLAIAIYVNGFLINTLGAMTVKAVEPQKNRLSSTFRRGINMSKLLAAIVAVMFAFGTTAVLAADDMKKDAPKVDCKDAKNKDNAACKVDCKDAKNKDNAACKPAAKK